MSKWMWFLYGVAAGSVLVLEYLVPGSVFGQFVQDYREGYRIAHEALSDPR